MAGDHVRRFVCVAAGRSGAGGTALMWSDERGVRVKMLTHDRPLATASRASGLEVLAV